MKYLLKRIQLIPELCQFILHRFALMPFGWVCARMLPRGFETHSVEQGWETVHSP
jgi:hypothetical protein